MLRRRALVLLVLACCAPVSASLADDPEGAFQDAAVPLLQSFIFSNYRKFAASELTFRHLKTHLAEKLGLEYEVLSRDELSEVIETATDLIANECKMGEVPIARCKRLVGYKDKEEL